MNIAIIYGGRSGEHEISLISAAAIARAVVPKSMPKKLVFSMLIYPPSNVVFFPFQ